MLCFRMWDKVCVWHNLAGGHCNNPVAAAPDEGNITNAKGDGEGKALL